LGEGRRKFRLYQRGLGEGKVPRGGGSILASPHQKGVSSSRAKRLQNHLISQKGGEKERDIKGGFVNLEWNNLEMETLLCLVSMRETERKIAKIREKGGGQEKAELLRLEILGEKFV